MQAKQYKISFCIVCMNRLHQLKETLLQNIEDNEDYDNLEFVVLNYNSEDGMNEWIRNTMSKYISSGKMKYYHTTEPSVFSHSHSKNLAFKLADGDIVCNINADHYTGKGFAEYVNEEFSKDDSIVLTTIDYFRTQKGYSIPHDVFGKVCVKKQDFLNVQGFDERMTGYGFEDWDFINRLELSGLKRIFIREPSFLKFISHEKERYSLEDVNANLQGIYVQHCKPSLSKLLFLYKDETFEKGTVIDNASLGSENYESAYLEHNHRFEYSIEEKQWIQGIWSKKDEKLICTFADGRVSSLLVDSNTNTLEDVELGKTYYRMDNEQDALAVTDFNYFYHNRCMMEQNLEEGKLIVNEGIIGKSDQLNKYLC